MLIVMHKNKAVGIMTKIINFLFSTDGEIGRDEFWSYHIVLFIIAFITNFIFILVGENKDLMKYDLMKYSVLIFSFLYIWSFFVVYIKRFHDLGKSGSMVMLLFVPIVNLWLLFKLGFSKGVETTETNKSEKSKNA